MALDGDTVEAPDPQGILGVYINFVRGACRLAFCLATLLVLVDLTLIGASVVLRYGFAESLMGADEIVAFSLTIIVMLAAPEVMRRHRHVAVDIIVGVLPSRLMPWVNAWAGLSVLIVAALLVINGWSTVALSHMIGSLTEGHLEWPTWVLQAFLPLGGVLLGLVAIEQIWRSVHELVGARRTTTTVTLVRGSNS